MEHVLEVVFSMQEITLFYHGVFSLYNNVQKKNEVDLGLLD